MARNYFTDGRRKGVDDNEPDEFFEPKIYYRSFSNFTCWVPGNSMTWKKFYSFRKIFGTRYEDEHIKLRCILLHDFKLIVRDMRDLSKIIDDDIAVNVFRKAVSIQVHLNNDNRIDDYVRFDTLEYEDENMAYVFPHRGPHTLYCGASEIDGLCIDVKINDRARSVPMTAIHGYQITVEMEADFQISVEKE